MTELKALEKKDPVRVGANERAEFRHLWETVILRLTLLYFIPMVVVAFFFNYQYRSLIRESERIHLAALASRQAATLDLFLSERLINLSNTIDDPAFSSSMTSEDLARYLKRLKRTSPAFAELGLLGRDGQMLAYSGPIPSLGSRSYAREPWFTKLREGGSNHIITDIYRGFRDQPHFTVAVSREEEQEYLVLRAVLSPDRIYEELVSDGHSGGFENALVNSEGIYQVVDPRVARPLARSPFRPPIEPRTDTANSLGEQVFQYGYAWLNTSPWAVVVFGARAGDGLSVVGGVNQNILIISVIFLLVGVVAIWLHARTSVRRLWKARKVEQELSGQLIQAAKLASVGELAAGIAHEINNPLAIIAEEVGLLKDLMDPELGGDLAGEDLMTHLNTMHAAVFRGRDITRKLLGFVRKTEVKIERHDIHDVLEEVAVGHLGHELELSNIEIVREYGANPSVLMTDRNQLQQVLLNLMKNAVDAMGASGKLTLRSESVGKLLRVSISDNGCGMTREQMERIFQPFYTTKDPGKGTGLGLSVSQGIVESLGGTMFVDSVIGEGSTLTIELPLDGG